MNYKITPLFFCIIVLITSNICFAGIFNKKAPYKDNGKIVYEGNFPIDQNTKDDERKNVIIAHIKLNENIIGTIESRDNNLKLIYQTKKNKKTVWEYTDYYAVKKITFDDTNQFIRIYYDGALLREKWFVNEFNINTFELKKRLLRKGKWRL
jgi:hypothetical protein